MPESSFIKCNLKSHRGAPKMATLTSVITGSLKAQGLQAGCPPLSFNLRQEGHSVSLISHPFNASVSGRKALERATGTSVTTSARRTLVVCREGGRNPADVGLCYGRMSSHVPTTPETLQLYKSNGISKMMLSQTDEKIIPLLQLLCKDSNASSEQRVVLCIDYKDLSTLANKEKAELWVKEYINPFQNVISHVVVGDVIGYDDFSLTVFDTAMRNIHESKLPETIKLSILVNVHYLLRDPYFADTPPSSCRLSDNSIAMLNCLSNLYDHIRTFPLFVQIMPFFIPASPKRTRLIPLDNYLLQETADTYMKDEQYEYKQVYDAMLDSICCALHRESFDGVDKYVVSGWPTAGKPAAGNRIDPSVKNAKTYNKNLAVHGETPRNNIASKIFIYSLVDEDKLGTPVEEFKHFGTFIPWNIMTFPNPNGGQPY